MAMTRLLSLMASLAPRHVPLSVLMSEADQYAVQPEQTATWRLVMQQNIPIRSDARELRDDVKVLRQWINHWEADRAIGQFPSDQSLAQAKAVADRVLQRIGALS